MSNISKIESFNYNNITTLKQNVVDKQYLILDLWESVDRNNHRQIFLQLNDVKVLNRTNDIILFDITDRNDIIQPLINIENTVLSILKTYLARINKHGKFNFSSSIKENKLDNTTILSLNLNNSDYPINIYNNLKQHSNVNIFNNNSSFNIILEVMSIQFDMYKGLIVMDTRFRLAIENILLPKRIKITNVGNFLANDNTVNEYKVNHSKIVSDIHKNFSNINTSDNDINLLNINEKNQSKEKTSVTSDNDIKLVNGNEKEKNQSNEKISVTSDNDIKLLNINETEINHTHEKLSDTSDNDSDLYDINEIIRNQLNENIPDTSDDNQDVPNINEITYVYNKSPDVLLSDNDTTIEEQVIKLGSDTDNITDDIIVSLKKKQIN
jgi:hypothetical protein